MPFLRRNLRREKLSKRPTRPGRPFFCAFPVGAALAAARRLRLLFIHHHAVPGHLLPQQDEIGHTAGGAGLLGHHFGIGEQLVVALHVEVLLILVGDRSLNGKDARQIHRHEKLVVGAVGLVLDALVQLGDAAGIVRGIIHREGEIVFQIDLSRLVQFVEKLQILQLVGYHVKLSHNSTSALIFSHFITGRRPSQSPSLKKAHFYDRIGKNIPL